MVILDRSDDPDTRDLIFAAQTLVEELVPAPPDHKKFGSKKSSKNQEKPLFVSKWVQRTILRKLSLAKEINIIPKL